MVPVLMDETFRIVPSISSGGMPPEAISVHQCLAVWRQLIRAVAADPETPYAEVVFDQIESRPDLHYELESGCLDVFERAKQQRGALVRFWLEALEHRGERVQVFVCDLLSDPVFLESARAEMGYRLERLLRVLERTAASPRTRQYAAALLSRLETSATSLLEMAARGELNVLGSSERMAIEEALAHATPWFRTGDVTTMAVIHPNPSWGANDYAHAALQLFGHEPTFPVELERLCQMLGVYLQGVALPSELDGLFIQRPGLPGPVILYNSSTVGSRCRFTIAHELGHALLPGHAQQTFHLSSVVEAAEPPVLDPAQEEVAAATTLAFRTDDRLEREADQFAAALLMPLRWFGPAVRRQPFTLQGLKSLAHSFGVSLTAAAFQGVRQTPEAVSVVYSVGGRVLYQRMTDEFRDAIGADAEVFHRIRPGTGAAEILEEDDGPSTREAILPATLWMSGANLAEVREESQKATAGHVLSFITPVEDQ